MTEKSTNPIREVLNSYKSAVFAKDVDAFMALYDENITVYDTWGAPWNYEGSKAWRGVAHAWLNSLGDERVVVDFDDVRINLTSDMAVASTYVKYTAVSADGVFLRCLDNRMTCVLVLKQGVWKIIHEHTSAPADSETLKISMKR